MFKRYVLTLLKQNDFYIRMNLLDLASCSIFMCSIFTFMYIFPLLVPHGNFAKCFRRLLCVFTWLEPSRKQLFIMCFLQTS